MSVLADQFLGQIQAAGLVQPETEYRFHPARRWRFDLAFPRHKLAVEIDGGTWVRGRHVTGTGFAADCDKGNEALLLGWRVLHFTNTHVKDGSALTTLTRALAGCAVEQVAP